MKGSTEIVYKETEGASQRFKVRETEDGATCITIYSKSVSPEEIVPLVIKQKRCAKRVPNLAISWTAIS